MRKTIKKICAAALALVFVCAGASGCSSKSYETLNAEGLKFVQRGDDGLLELIRTSENLTFYTSDDSLTEFMNDFYTRHIRSGEESIGTARMGACWSYAKEWEALALSWFDSTALALKEYDADALMQRYINSIDIDKFGNAYVWFNDTDFPVDARAYDMPGQGWVFPDYSELGTYGSEFSQSADGWTVGGKNGNVSGGYLNGSFYGKEGETYDLISAETSFSADLAPFVEIRMILEDLANSAGIRETDIADYGILWKKEGEGSGWHEVKASEFASNPVTLSQYNKVRTYFPMYLHPDWNGTVTQVGVRIYPKTGESLDINVRLEYFRTMADTRQSTSSAKYILTLEEMTSYSNDLETVANNIGRARQAFMFQAYALHGADGLVDLTYLPGHDSALGTGHRIGNGYYDIYPPCNLNLEANMYFYLSCIALANMEQALLDAGIETEQTAVANYDPYGVFDESNEGKGDIVYDFTPETLSELAATIKTNVQRDYDKGGFWNPETGRYAWGIYDENSYGEAGKPLDYGMVETNVRMVFHGLATDEQAQSIYSWLDGTRTVEGDTSTGSDIYFYQFGPRSTTRDNQYDYTSIYRDAAFSVKVQDGGAILYTSYYDVIARQQLLGSDASYERLSDISEWYHEVMNAGGTGTSFYQTYYAQKRMEDIDNYDYYTLQGGGSDGALGLDNEFYESAMIYAILPQAYLGLDGNYSELSITPDLPEELTYIAMTNLKFGGHKYDCLAADDQLILSGITGDTAGLTVCVTFKVPERSSYKVLVNGEATTDFTVQGNTIVMNVPFGNVNIAIQ